MIRFLNENGIFAQSALLLGACMFPVGTVRKLTQVSGEAPMTRRRLKRSRISAFREQGGRCYYCNQPMWEVNPEAFASKRGLTLRQAKQLRSTAEHLVARSEGGDDGRSNIVAACWQCNRLRHRPRRAKAPEDWRHVCRKRVSAVRWRERPKSTSGGIVPTRY